jgi:hypothetical protein
MKLCNPSGAEELGNANGFKRVFLEAAEKDEAEISVFSNR